MCYCMYGGWNKMSLKTGPCPSCSQDSNIPPGYIEDLIRDKINSGVELAEEKVYKERLRICENCDSCVNKMLCMKCGCFVQIRALDKIARCPHPDGDKWMSVL